MISTSNLHNQPNIWVLIKVMLQLLETTWKIFTYAYLSHAGIFRDNLLIRQI